MRSARQLRYFGQQQLDVAEQRFERRILEPVRIEQQTGAEQQVFGRASEIRVDPTGFVVDEQSLDLTQVLNRGEAHDGVRPARAVRLSRGVRPARVGCR